MNETVLRIKDDAISVETIADGVKSFKQIAPDSLLSCINQSLLRGAVSSGLLPRNCLSFTAYDCGDKDICILHPEERADISYVGTEYKDFPLPRLIFGFHVSKEGKVSRCRLGVVDNDLILKPKTKMYHYPLSNVSGFSLCVGNNILPKCESLHTLTSLPYHILLMPNNNDHYRSENNKNKLEMRDLLEFMKDKPAALWYSEILVPSGKVLNDFIKWED